MALADFKRTGHRISLLGVARFCSEAPLLSERHGAGRPAAISKAFHARQAKEPGWQEQYARLTEDERLQLEEWKVPGTVVIREGDDHIELDFPSSEKEVLLGLNEHGSYIDPAANNVMLRGYMDFGWIREARGSKVAYACDIKKSEWTTSEGPNDLQVAAYGFAYASKHDCSAFVPAIWAATEGTWQWGEWVDLESSHAADMWASVRAAALNKKSGYVTGQHCRSCWSRMHCQEHVLPAVSPDSALAPMGPGGQLTSENALRALLHIQAIEEVAAAAKRTLQEAVRRGLRIEDPVTKKVYKLTKCPGRDSVSVESLRAAMGDDASRYIKRGADYSRFIWGKG